MKEKYTRSISFGEVIAICFVTFLVLCISRPLILYISLPLGSAGLELAMMATLLLLVAMCFLIICYQQANFEADDSHVKFSYFGIKKLIRYDDIKCLELERRNSGFNSKNNYVETLTITTKRKTYVFSAIMDINHDKVAKDPAYLTEQFENSQFSQLKRYIESKK
jgi:hypothetical protein